MLIVDMRSDTLTLPTPEMRRAMAEAEVGDDVYGEDPTVNRLEAAAAQRTGKEAALLVSSGTLGNLIALLINSHPSEEVIVDSLAHTFLSEVAGSAAVAGIQLFPITTEAGVMRPNQLTSAIRSSDIHLPRTAAILIENSHNRHGGIAWPLSDLRAVAGAAHAAGLKVHIDGARVFNAALASGADVSEISGCADTMTFCLSKGLGCPIGSVLVGSAPMISVARRWRKMLGGGMRQAGIIAAAGLIALNSMVDRLVEDHVNARILAEGLGGMKGIRIDLTRVQTNLVYFEPIEMSPRAFVEACRPLGLLGLAYPTQVRLVTRFGIETSSVKNALRIVSRVVSA